MPTGIQKPTRRYHKKSRTGCTGCRSRRIKCDETHPSCANCQRAGLDCHYTAKSQASSLATSPQNHSPSPRGSTCNGYSGIPQPATISIPQTPAGNPSSSFDMLDLTLMHHYTTTTSTSLFGEAQRELWQIEIPLMARSSPLLMHGLLATAALHMAFLNKDDSDSSVYTSRALYHHSLGLGLFNTDITGLGAENANSPVLFTFGLFLVIWAYASPTLPTANAGPVAEKGHGNGNGDSSAGDLATLLASLELVRGNKVIFELSSETILSQPIGRFTMPSNKPLSSSISGSTSNSEPQSPSQLESHQHPISRSSPQSTSADASELRSLTTQTLSYLRHKTSTDFIDFLAIGHIERALLDTLTTSASDMRQPLGWPALVDTPFWERVRRRKPAALVILAHYAVILAHYEGRAWWMGGWARRLVGAVEGALRQIEGDGGSLGVDEWRGCLDNVKMLLGSIRGLPQ